VLNTDLDIKTLRENFHLDKRLKIENFLKPEIAEQLRNACLNHVPFSLQYVLDGEYQSKTPAELSKLTPQEANDMHNKVLTEASKGVGFLYDGYLRSRVDPNSSSWQNEELEFAHKVFDDMSSDDVINVIKQITDNQEINGAEPQYTRYTNGHFLTRHLDIVPGRGRRFAFVLGLTKDWHPDWGGLLQFYEENGTPRDAWMPEFNTLSIFEVTHVHSVSYVTPFAAAPRLSLTGWFVVKD